MQLWWAEETYFFKKSVYYNIVYTEPEALRDN